MPALNVDGINLAYDIVGEGTRTAIITPGGRFSKDTPGVRELAEKLAEEGFRTIIWDRPNCGESDLCFTGSSESALNANALAGLLRGLNASPALVVGGSAGSRVSLLTAIRHPDVVERLFLLWISGSPVSLASLAYHYCHDSLAAAATDGMEAVAALPTWSECLTRNPRNRALLLGQDVPAFMATMKRWAAAFFSASDSEVPGTSRAELATLSMPVMILRSGISDIHHPRETSEAVQAAIPGARIAEPPWEDREWLNRMSAAARGQGLFAHWPRLAPQILEFAKHRPTP